MCYGYDWISDAASERCFKHQLDTYNDVYESYGSKHVEITACAHCKKKWQCSQNLKLNPTCVNVDVEKQLGLLTQPVRFSCFRLLFSFRFFGFYSNMQALTHCSDSIFLSDLIGSCIHFFPISERKLESELERKFGWAPNKEWWDAKVNA